MGRVGSASSTLKGADRTGSDDLAIRSRGVWISILLVATLLSLVPISADDTWWHLSRGRAVIAGTVFPSRDLLANDEAAEADWLGGVPWFLAYRVSGVSGLLLVRLFVIAGTIFLLMSDRTQPSLWAEMPVLAAGVLAAAEAWQPTPALLDVLGLVVLWKLTSPSESSSWESSRSSGIAIGAAVALLLWANLAPRVALGPMLLALTILGGGCRATVNDMRSKRLVSGGRLLAALVACSATPRGWWTLWDSLRVLFPRLAADSATLEGTPWQPLMAVYWNVPELAFLCLSGLALVLIAVVKPRFVTAIRFLLGQGLAWSSAANLAPAAIWLLLLVIDVLREPPLATWLSRPERSLCGTSKKRPALIAALALMAPAMILALAPRMGWGFDRRLDHRLLAQALAAVQPFGSAFCDDARSTGMLCWLSPPQMKAQDLPLRALLGGRLRDERLLLNDLKREYLWSYNREDGTQGGWWIPFEQRNTSLVFVSADDPDLIRALEPTLWKPLLLDSVVIAFAEVGDPHYNARLVEVLQQRKFLDTGPWTFALARMSGSEFDRDIWGLWPDRWSAAEVLRQVQVFRAMQLYTAALKILSPVLKDAPNPELHQEFARCQLELLHRERLLAGQASRFRTLAASAAGHGRYSGFADANLADGGAELGSEVENLLNLAVERYLKNDLQSAVRALEGDDPEVVYALACLWLESGQPDPCAATLRRLPQKSPGTSVQLLARQLLETVAPERAAR